MLEALQVMMENNISALLVIEGGQLLGIFTERDYARKIILVGRSSRETLISDVMTANPHTVTPSDTIEYCMQLILFSIITCSASSTDMVLVTAITRGGLFCSICFTVFIFF